MVTVELWMDQEFEHAHEMRALRAVLGQLVEHFGSSKDLYLLLANFMCDGVQIDLAVIKKNGIAAIELKECSQAVTGGPNGDWRIQGGGALNVGRANPYQQVRQCRYALLNYLMQKRYEFLPNQKARNVNFEHVSGLVVFSPALARGSQIEIAQRDKKWFQVLGLDELWTEVNDMRSPAISLDQGDMRKLAAAPLGLKRVNVAEYLRTAEPQAQPELEEELVPPEPVPPAIPVKPAPSPLREKEALASTEPPVRVSAGVLAAAPLETPGPDYARLSQPLALDIIKSLRSGTVPQAGLEYLAVGLDREVRAIGGQLKHVATGRGDFKFVRGAYGAGKTFLSALAVEEALAQGFATSYVVVSTDTPLYRLESIYHRIIANLRTRGQQSGALKGIVDRWLYKVEEKIIELEGYEEDDPRLGDRVEAEIESGLAEMAQLHSAFSSAVRGYYRAQLDNDYASAQALLGWLSGEQQISAQVKRKVGIRGEIDNTVALEFLRAVNTVARKANLAGLLIAFDEVETIQRLRGPQREQSLSTLRQLVDAIDHGEFPYTYLMFTGTPGFYDDRMGVPSLPPLNERIRLLNPEDPYPNPEWPQIVLRGFDSTKLRQVADKVLRIYGIAHEPADRQRVTESFVDFMIAEVTSKFGGRVDVVPRQFLRDFVNVLDKARQYQEYNPDAEYEFDRDAIKEELTPTEQEAIEPITF